MVTLLPGAERLLAEQAAELPQKDDLCGAFWGLVALRAAGRRASPSRRSTGPGCGRAGRRQRALRATPDQFAAARRERPRGLPARIADREHGERRRGRPPVGSPAQSPNSRAGPWSPYPRRARGTDACLLDLLAATAALPAPLAVLANVATGALWDTRVRPDQIAHYLQSGQDTAPSSTWQVGHFVAVIGFSPGPRGTLVKIADSYRSRGPDGIHVQPSQRLAAALRRDGERPGGLLLVLAAQLAASGRALRERRGPRPVPSGRTEAPTPTPTADYCGDGACAPPNR